jgi:hypothetical protein
MVTITRRGGHWTLNAVRVTSDGLQTSVAAARQFFQFDADDRRLLDSVGKTRRPSRAPPPNDR